MADSYNSKQSPYFNIGSTDQYLQEQALSLGRRSIYEQPQNSFQMPLEEYGDNIFEMNIEDEVKREEDRTPQTDSRNSRSQYSASYELEKQLESGDQINLRFKPELKIPQNQGKSIYTDKITQLLDKKRTSTTSSISPSITPRSSKSQQKLERKNSTLNQTESSDLQSEQQNSSKLAKNRESAKNSRERKKIYYDLLEKKVQELEEENEKLKETLRNQTQNLDFVNKKTQKFQQFLEQQQSLFDKLEICLLKSQDPTEINIILDALRYRINSNTQERNDTVRVYFDSMAEVILPMQAKYLLYTIDQHKDFFGNNQHDLTEWMLDAYYKSNISFDQLSKLKKFQQKVQIIKQTISDSLSKMKEQIKTIQDQASKLDQVWDCLKQIMNPFQLGCMMCSIYHNSYKKEMQTSNLFEQLRNSQAEEDFNFNDSPVGNQSKKIIKK
ncbi:hypothetical protein pb186bvf_016617 [Paramecium bursaria]